MKIDIDIETYLSEEEMKEIAKDVFIQKLGESMGTEADIDRIIGNTGYRFMFNAFDKQYDCDLEKILREKIKKTIEEKDISFYLFRKKDAWEKEDSAAVKIIDDECNKSRPLIKEMVEKHIKEYPFDELDKNEITETIADVISNRLFTEKGGAE